MSKERFIGFVKNNPALVDYVKKNNTSWQSLYEVYALYGENEEVWSKYLNSKENSVNELVGMIKNINLESVRKVVDGLQRTISLVQDISGKGETIEPYEKRQKHSEQFLAKRIGAGRRQRQRSCHRAEPWRAHWNHHRRHRSWHDAGRCRGALH